MIYPKHVWLIPDWNRTWARNNWYPKFSGHLQWFNTVINLTKYIFGETWIQVFTVWWLSTENSKGRDDEELSYLFDLYKQVPQTLFNFLEENKVNFRWIGKPDWLPSDLVDFLQEKEKQLDFESERFIIMAVNYWWRDEISRGVRELTKEYMQVLESKDDIDKKVTDKSIEKDLENKLDLAWFPEIELVIRTKWEYAKRLSGFMLWWIWYAELYFTKKYCPELDKEEFEKAIEWFNSVYEARNFGK